MLPVISLARKIELTIGVLLLVTVAVLSVQVWIARNRADVVKEDLHIAQADIGANAVYQQDMEINRQLRTAQEARVNVTIERNREWAAVELPSDVADQLRNSEGTARAVP